MKILLEYEYINKSHIVITAFELINDNKEEIYVSTYHNKDDVLYKNFVFLINLFFIISKKLQILIYFRMTENNTVKMWYTPVNTDRMIIKHYGD